MHMPKCAGRRLFVESLESRNLLSAGPTAASTLVLYNSASATGMQIANFYAQVHPGVHLLGLSGVDPNLEDMTADNYLSIIRPQVLSALTPSIDVIVTTKGLPLRITVTEPQPPAIFPNPPSYVDPTGVTRMIFNWQPYSSLESELATIDTVSTWQMMGDQSFVLSGHFTANPYYRSTESFSFANYGIRLTSRLDGFTVSDVQASILKAQQAYVGPLNNPTGPFYFLVDDDPTISYGFPMDDLVNNVLLPGGLPVVYDNTTAFVGTAPGPVLGYDSHGVHQASTPANYILNGLNVALANGAVFNSWESYNAYSFQAGYSAWQGQVAQWIQKGGTAGVGNVQEPGASPNTVVNEDLMFQMLLAGHTWAESAWSALRQLSYVNTVVGDPLMIWKALPAPGISAVVNRQIFYNGSLWDSYDLAAGPADDAAIAPDKSAYLPGTGATTFANITSYSRGINGIMIDISGSHPNITASDFTFRVGNNNAPNTWSAAPAPTAVSVRAGAGVGGTDRVEIIWNNGDISNTWLEITVVASANTGLSAPDVFYFGNRIGDAGFNWSSTFTTNATDTIATRTNQGVSATASNVFDFNRSGIVNATDQVIVINNQGMLLKINIAAAPAAPEASPAIVALTSDGDDGVATALAGRRSATAPSSDRASTSNSPPNSAPAPTLPPRNDLVSIAWQFLAVQFDDYDSPQRRAIIAAIDELALNQVNAKAF